MSTRIPSSCTIAELTADSASPNSIIDLRSGRHASPVSVFQKRYPCRARVYFDSWRQATAMVSYSLKQSSARP